MFQITRNNGNKIIDVAFAEVSTAKKSIVIDALTFRFLSVAIIIAALAGFLSVVTHALITVSPQVLGMIMVGGLAALCVVGFLWYAARH